MVQLLFDAMLFDLGHSDETCAGSCADGPSDDESRRGAEERFPGSDQPFLVGRFMVIFGSGSGRGCSRGTGW